jgi:glycosyltransferase involved in cell wall biosynthesis
MQDFPNILVVSEQPFSLDNGFGVTLSNLFDGWPQERIACFYTYKYYQSQPFQKFCVFQKPAHVRWHHGRRHAIPMLVGVKPAWRNNYSSLWLKRNLAGYKPSIIYSLVHSEATLLFADWIAHSLRVPHVIHIADDNFSLEKRILDAMQSASMRYVISKQMAEEYNTRYNTNFQVLHNVPADDYFRKTSSEPKDLVHSAKAVKTIRYLGRLHPWLHYNSLQLLRCAIDKCCANGMRWQLELYGSAEEEILRKSEILSDHVSFHGPVSQSYGIHLLHSADLLVIPLTYQTDLLRTYRLSFPTKLPEYLATGVPILLLSDISCASALFCQEHSAAYCVTTPDIDQIIEVLTRLWISPSEGIYQGEHNVALARSKFNKEEISSFFQASLCSVVNKVSSVQ